jgi:thymidylate synthase ThyX
MAVAPASPFVSAAPAVRLVNAFAEPFNNAIATARTCYMPRVMTPADMRRDARSVNLRDAIAKSTYAAGHHTTLQHATFQFAIENVSRQFLWSFLHAHPFYNSEQVSQRYVSVRPDRVLVPNLPEKAQARYVACVQAQMACYLDLVKLLTPPAAAAFFQVFPARRKKADLYASAIKKRAQEVARYALPVATFAHLYHTISGLTLHRYHRLSRCFDVPEETAVVVQAMVDAVQAHDPLFFRNIEDPVPLEATHEYVTLQGLAETGLNGNAAAFCRAFDQELAGKASRLLDYSVRGEQTLARAVRNVLGLEASQLDDGAAIDRVLSSAHNPNLGGALNLTSLGKLSRSMMHVHYTFQKKLSHSADSQDQRHRLTPATRPVLHRHYAPGTPDVVVPKLIAENPAAEARFMACMQDTWDSIDALLDAGVAPSTAMYLLPNAYPIRFEASGDLTGWHHKWVSRLCYNAQEEIWHAAIDEALAVRAVHPRIGRYLMPPCGVRRDAGLRPICPEGPRYCGVPVWKQDIPDYVRTI